MSSPGVRGPWSDGETSALIQAWGLMYLACSGGSLHIEEWRQVCSAINAHRAAAGLRFNRSRLQCQKRVYTIKDQYQKELAKGKLTSGWRHFAQLRAFLAGPENSPPPGFAAKMPSSYVKEEEVVEEEEEEEEVEEKEGGEDASDGASGSVWRKTVPAKHHFYSLQDILDRSGGPAPGFPPRMLATAKKQKVEGEEEVKEEVETEGPASAGCCPPAVVTKLAEVYECVEMERVSMEKEKMAMEREKRAGKVEAENLGETVAAAGVCNCMPMQTQDFSKK